MNLFLGRLLAATLGCSLALCVAGVAVTAHHRQVRATAEAGVRQEIRDNLAGVHDLRQALMTESKNIAEAADLLQAKADGHTVPASSLHLGLAVMAFTDANWQAATTTGATEAMDFASVAHFAGAYFEQARLAQLQTATMDSMMALQSYVGRGDQLSSLTPEQARSAAVQARLLLAHLRNMSRMTDGVQDAYSTALGAPHGD